MYHDTILFESNPQVGILVWIYLYINQSPFFNPSLALPTSQLILKPFRCFTYVTDHCPTLLSLLLCHRIFTYVTCPAAHDGHIFKTFVEQRGDIELTEGQFQQHGATCHTSDSMRLIANNFGECVISKKISPDLTSPDFFLRDYLRDRVQKNRARALAELHEAITNEIRDINRETFRKTSKNMMRRAHLCLHAGE